MYLNKGIVFHGWFHQNELDCWVSVCTKAGLDLVQDWQLAYVEGLQKAGQDVKLLFLEKATIGFYFLPNNDHFYTTISNFM